MELRDYEYRGLMAQAWDAIHPHPEQAPDRCFYRDLIERHGQPVLDIGCGTGRLLLDYLALGIDADGMDNSPEMLARCRLKAARLGLQPTLYEQHLECIDLPRRYRTILIPTSTLQYVTHAAQALHTLRRIRDHLLPGGVIAAEFQTLWMPGRPFDMEWEHAGAREDDGETFQRAGRYRYDPATECVDTEECFRLLRDGTVLAEETHRRSQALRSYTVQQARDLFERAGFADVTAHAAPAYCAATEADALFAVVARVG